MVELKQKVTLKRKREFVTVKPDQPKKGQKLIIPLVILGLFGVFIAGYFLFPSKEVENGSDSIDSVEIIDELPAKSESSNSPEFEQGSVIAESHDSGADKLGKNINQNVSGDDQNIPNNANNQQADSPHVSLPYKKGEKYKVYQFPFGVADYSQPNPELDKLVEIMNQNPGIKIAISAYTDSVGDPEFNKILSEKRAKAINDYLVGKGINKSRLTFQGKGISTVYATNSENRRAEFILID